MKRTVATVLTSMIAAAMLLIPTRADATLPSDPAAACSGVDSMFCKTVATGKTTANYVDVVSGVQNFCVKETYSGGLGFVKTTCHTYWPFVDPTVNADQAPPSAFTAKRLVATKSDVDSLRSTVSEQKQTIAQQAHRIKRMEHRIQRLRRHQR